MSEVDFSAIGTLSKEPVINSQYFIAYMFYKI